jgi:hypothetical protein
MLEKENDVKIAKLVWLSKKDSGKAYGSMAVYVSKSNEATKLLQGQYFHIAGESAYTRVFEPRLRPDQCYQCQEIGYKAYSCNKQVIVIASVSRRHQSVYRVEDLTNRIAKTAGRSILLLMCKTLKVFQLNLRKQREVQQSVMNDDQLQDFAILALSEPYAFLKEDRVITAPIAHVYWTKMIPTSQRAGRWPIRSMLWIRKDLDSEQIPIQSPDLTAALLHLTDRAVFVVSTYVEPANQEALQQTIIQLQTAIYETQRRVGIRMDIIIVGDFNRHDYL